MKGIGLLNSQDIDLVVEDSFDEGEEMVAEDAKKGSIRFDWSTKSKLKIKNTLNICGYSRCSMKWSQVEAK